MKVLPRSLRLPRKEDAHFLSLIAVGALLMTVFVMFIGAAGHKASRADNAAENFAPQWRRKSLEGSGSRSQSWAALDSRIVSMGRGTLEMRRSERILVVYLYDREDAVSDNNMGYFVNQALDGHDGCDFVFIVRGAGDAQLTNSLPRLPVNARYYYSGQKDCVMGLSAVDEMFTAGTAKRSDYQYFIVVHSAFRGPFIPSYAAEEKHWTQYFTQKINDTVKLVAPTISCQPLTPLPPESNNNELMPPFAQFSVIATDQAGLAVLESDPDIWSTCHPTRVEAIEKSEMAASAAMLQSNFTLDSFMSRYRKVDWRRRSNWGCNSGLNPVMEFNYDGSSIHPYEVMFVPMNTIAIENGWSYAKLAALYETWSRLQDDNKNDVTSNYWVSDPWPIKRQRMAYMQSRGPGCFDNRYYLQQNPDLQVIPSVLELWDHFVMMGQFEGRSFRWSCEDDRKLPWEQ